MKILNTLLTTAVLLSTTAIAHDGHSHISFYGPVGLFALIATGLIIYKSIKNQES